MDAHFSKLRNLVNLAVVLASFMCLGLLSACSPKLEAPVVGKWQTDQGNQALEFREDGSLAGRDKYDREISGSYEFIDSEHVRLEMTVRSIDKAAGTVGIDRATGVCRVVVDSDSMTLTEEDGSEVLYRRQAQQGAARK